MKGARQSLTRQAVGGIMWMTGGRGASMVLHVVVLAVLARLLSPADFGVVGAALVVTGFSAIFSQLGMGPALVQLKDLERRHIDTAFGFSMVFGLTLGATVWLGAPLAARFFGIELVEPALRWLALLFPLRGLGLVGESLATRELRFRWLAMLDVISYGVGYGVIGTVLAFSGWGIWALVTAELAKATCRSTILLASRRPSRRPIPELAALRELLYFGGGFTVARIANYLALQGDNLVVGRVLGATALGYYTRAYQLMTAPASGLGNILDSVLFPAMARVQGDRPRLARAYRSSVAVLAVVMLPASIALIVLAPEVVRVVLGPKWTAVVVPFQILAAGMLFRTTYKMSDSLARATGAVYRRAWRQGVYAALVIGGSWLGSRWGIPGVAAGVLLALVVNFLLMAGLSLRLVDMRWWELGSAFLPAVRLAGACLPVLGFGLAAMRHWTPSATLVLAGTLTACAAWVLLLIRVAPRWVLGQDVLRMIDPIRETLSPRLRSRHAPKPPVSREITNVGEAG